MDDYWKIEWILRADRLSMAAENEREKLSHRIRPCRSRPFFLSVPIVVGDPPLVRTLRRLYATDKTKISPSPVLPHYPPPRRIHLFLHNPFRRSVPSVHIRPPQIGQCSLAASLVCKSPAMFHRAACCAFQDRQFLKRCSRVSTSGRYSAVRGMASFELVAPTCHCLLR